VGGGGIVTEDRGRALRDRGARIDPTGPRARAQLDAAVVAYALALPLSAPVVTTSAPSNPATQTAVPTGSPERRNVVSSTNRARAS
jgi:hypothetical protein